MDKKEYNELLVKYYTENNSFIEKGIFTVSAGALTFLIGLSEKIYTSTWYVIALLGFAFTIILQLVAARVSKEGCDLALDEENSGKANLWFKYSEIINNIFLITFILSIIISACVVVHSNNMTKQSSSNNAVEQSTIEQKFKTDNIEYSYIKKGEIMKEKQNGLNPPKSTQPNKNVKGGFNPPKTTQPKNNKSK